MEKDYLLAKWLSGEITQDELEALQKLEDLGPYEKIVKNSAYLKAPDYNADAEWARLKVQLKPQSKKVKFITWSYVTGIAASVAVLFAVYWFAVNRDTLISTDYAQKTDFTLPDASVVTLNSGSKAGFNKNDWDEKREVTLEGEAFFKVAQGKKFDVITSAGTISVLGTQFNVKNRENYFEVSCFEGKVQVASKDTIVQLLPGNTIRVINNLTQFMNEPLVSTPLWIQDKSAFKSIPYSMVVDEVERIYNIEITMEKVDTNYHFTGEVTHSNKEVALLAITRPLNLTYTINNNNVIIRANNGQ